jgi:hypothetical protein
MSPVITVSKADLALHPELISQLQGMSIRWEEAQEKLGFKVAPGKLMPLIGLLTIHHLSYQVEFPNNDKSQ